MKLFEMEGFLRGKCVPGDMLVNETNAQYLVRKISGLEAQVKQLAAQLEFSVAAERTWETTMMRVCGEDGPLSVAGKFNQLAAENAKLADCANFYRLGFKPVKGAFGIEYRPTEQLLDDCGNTALEAIKTPASDAVLASLRAEGVETLVNSLLSESFRIKAAAALADFDGVTGERLKQIVWSGQPPEPEGCVWDVEYMTRAWVVMKVIKEFSRQLRESKGEMSNG